MRTVIFLSALLGVVAACTNLSAADIPPGQLAAIGLGNMKPMSHEAALQVRGRGLGDIDGGWSEDRRGWNSWNEHSHHHHHHHHQVAHCLPPSHCQPAAVPYRRRTMRRNRRGGGRASLKRQTDGRFLRQGARDFTSPFSIPPIRIIL